jgi:predicted PurR-regulated permease PerM
MKKISSLSSFDAMKKLINMKAKPFRSRLPKTKREDSLIIDKLPGYFLLFTLMIALYFLFEILRPFLSVIFLAAVLVISFYPVYKRLLKAFKGMARLASLVSCVLVVLVIIAPIAAFVIMLTNEAVDTYEVISDKVESGVFDKYLVWEDGGFFYDLKEHIDPFVDVESLDIKDTIIGAAQGLSSFLFEQTTNILKGISGIALNFVIMLFAMYYFFKDGKELVKKAGHISPLPAMHEGELFRKMDSMVKAIVFGVFFTAIVQGFLGGVGFAIAGISSPVFWGSAMAFLSLVPMVGTALIWIPAVVVLAILGFYWEAVFVMAWGIFVVGTVDNFLRPYLIGGKAKTYPLITFFVILGGIFTMGLKGIIVGPLVLMVVMSLLHIYEAEYSKVLKK